MSNQQIHIQFPDGSEKAYQAGVLAKEVAQSISQSLYKEAVVCRVNDRLVDLTHPSKRIVNSHSTLLKIKKV